MSRRPPDPRTLRVARSGQRMAPGGRRWSESPVPRVGKRRIRAVGAGPTWKWVGTGAVGLYPGVDDPGAVNWYDQERQPGDRLIVVAFGIGGLTAPSGWTTHYSGTATGYFGTFHWAVMEGVSAGGAPDTVEGVLTGFTGADCAGIGYCCRAAGYSFALADPITSVGPVTTSEAVSVTGSPLTQPVQMSIHIAREVGGITLLDPSPSTAVDLMVTYIYGASAISGTLPAAASGWSAPGPFENDPQSFDYGADASAVAISWGWELA